MVMEVVSICWMIPSTARAEAWESEEEEEDTPDVAPCARLEPCRYSRRWARSWAGFDTSASWMTGMSSLSTSMLASMRWGSMAMRSTVTGHDTSGLSGDPRPSSLICFRFFAARRSSWATWMASSLSAFCIWVVSLLARCLRGDVSGSSSPLSAMLMGIDAGGREWVMTTLGRRATTNGVLEKLDWWEDVLGRRGPVDGVFR